MIMAEIIKDVERQERLEQVYRHLFAYFGIKSKTDFADAIHLQRTALSAAMNGNKAYLTNNLFNKICAAFPGVFNLDYLLTGNGQLLTIKEEVHNEEYEKLYNPQPIDQSSLINATIAAKDETIASLKRELAAKDETITLQRSRIVALERQLAAATTDDLSHYPFAFGAAEHKEQPKIK